MKLTMTKMQSGNKKEKKNEGSLKQTWKKLILNLKLKGLRYVYM